MQLCDNYNCFEALRVYKELDKTSIFCNFADEKKFTALLLTDFQNMRPSHLSFFYHIRVDKKHSF